MRTHNMGTHMGTTNRVDKARFALQMADQASKVGGRIAERREELDLTQRELADAVAERIGDKALDSKQISRYETEGVIPRGRRLEGIASILSVSIADLYAGPVADREDPEAIPELADILQERAQDQDQLNAIEDKLDWIIERLPDDARVAAQAADDVLSATGTPGAAKPSSTRPAPRLVAR